MTRTFDVPQHVKDNQAKRAATERPHPCGEGVGDGKTCGQHPAVLYPRGYRCAAHTPGAPA